MNNHKSSYHGIRVMISDYMEKGFLENIIDMFKHDNGLYELIAGLIQDERIRVRVGVTALVEELKKSDAGNLQRAVPNLTPLLKYESPVVRGDTANLLGIIGDKTAIPSLEQAIKEEENPDVRILAAEALEEIRQQVL